MPIITCTVPPDINSFCAQKIRTELRAVLTDVPGLNVTVEFVPCLFPERLLIRYETRSVLIREAVVDNMAKVLGQVVEKHFRMRVECLVVYPNGNGRPGIYV